MDYSAKYNIECEYKLSRIIPNITLSSELFEFYKVDNFLKHYGLDLYVDVIYIHTVFEKEIIISADFKENYSLVFNNIEVSSRHSLDDWRLLGTTVSSELLEEVKKSYDDHHILLHDYSRW